MKAIAAIVYFWIPVGSIFTSLGIAYWQNTTPNGSVEVVVSGGCLFICAGLIWKQSGFQKEVTVKLESIEAKLETLVSNDHAELRLSQERNVSDSKYEARQIARGAGSNG